MRRDPTPKSCERCGKTFTPIDAEHRFCSRPCARNARPRKSIAFRLWRRVDRSVGADACWPFTGALDIGGYGVFAIDGRNARAHRVAYELTYGPVAPGLFVLHLCNFPPCCNPAHLVQGDHRLNMRHMVAAGRSAAGDRHPTRQHPEARPRGEGHAMAKLTEEDVRSIRARYVPRRVGSRELAREFGVSPPTILRAVHNKTWRHLSPAQIPVQLALPLFAEESPG